MRGLGVTLISLGLTSAVIGNAYYQKKQFYPSVVYITKSNPSMAVIYIQAFVMVILIGKLMRKVFFGQLRAAEFEHLMERSWYAVTETCLAFTVFRDDFSPKFVALFTVLLFLKSFHWLAEDRVDFMERSPVITWLFHLRVLSLLTMLGALDIHFVGLAYQSTITKGASVQLVFGFEYAILLTIIINIYIKYILHTLDMNSENPWENKAVFLLYTELVMGFFKVLLYIAFVAIMVRIYTLPLFAFRPMYYTMRSFKKAFHDVILSRRAIRNMNTLYPDATAEELAAADNVCIICREEMLATAASKKLPCNHIFHTRCLRSWFQRQQTCPTCRLNILRTPTPITTQQAPAAGAQPRAGGIPAGAQGALRPGGDGIPPIAPFPAMMFPFWPPAFQPGQAPQGQQQPQQQQPLNNNQNASSSQTGQSTGQPSSSATSGSASGSMPGMPPPPFPFGNMPLFCPPFGPFLPFTMPAPLPPTDYTGLSDEELRRMEADTREAIEARLSCLRNVRLLLDAASTLMQQHAAAAAAAAAAASVSASASATQLNTSTSADSTNQQTESSAPVNASTTNNENNVESDPSTSLEEAASLNSPVDQNQEELRRRRLQRFESNTTNETPVQD